MKLADSRTMRDADSCAIHVLGIPSTLLMTNAAKKLADTAAGFLGVGNEVAVFAGTGGNGGDGICAAALLLRRGADVRCFLVGDRENLSPDCAEMERRFSQVGGVLEAFDPFSPNQRRFALGAAVVIDAIFGIGLNRPLDDVASAAVELINLSPATVVSADIASGVSADTGAVLSRAVCADVTVAFSMAKPGHFVEPGGAFCGRLTVVNIGIPAAVLEGAETNINAFLPEEASLPRRKRISHKGDFGRLLIVGGSVGYSGAPVIASEAALRSGVGLVSLGVPEEIYAPVAGRTLEAMCFPLAGDGNGRMSEKALPVVLERLGKSDLGLVGCGLSRSEDLTRFVQTLLRESETPLVVDADGLFALGADADAVRQAKTPPVLTPHEGEFLRLGGKLGGDRLADALGFAESRNCVLVLKGHRTICAFPDGELFIIPAGNPGMAKGGSGDALAGLIGGFMCQLPLKKAVTTACMVHALAGDKCAESLGEYAMLPRDIIDTLPEIIKSISEGTDNH